MDDCGVPHDLENPSLSKSPYSKILDTPQNPGFFCWIYEFVGACTRGLPCFVYHESSVEFARLSLVLTGSDGILLLPSLFLFPVVSQLRAHGKLQLPDLE